MSWWIWVLIVIGGLVVLFVVVVFLTPESYLVKRELRRLERMTPQEREKEERQVEASRRKVARMLATSGTSTAFMGIARLVESGDIERLRQTFSFADWETRELVVVAFMNLIRDRPDIVKTERANLLNALDDIVALSKAETSGGTYRQNCIDQAQSMADRVRNA